MQIQIKYFGMAAERAGKSGEVIDCESDIRSLELRKKLTEQYGFDSQDLKISVNRKIIHDDIELKSNDEVAFLPPFAGG